MDKYLYFVVLLLNFKKIHGYIDKYLHCLGFNLCFS